AKVCSRSPPPQAWRRLGGFGAADAHDNLIVSRREKKSARFQRKSSSKHMTSEQGGRRPNRLAQEQSPYLRQHAYNPVDWYPWGEEARELARRENKPILLSIGYSACHWCHVMERESFENEAIARLMNERFVPIKVDREERPDLDQIYMDAVQL